MTLSTPGALTSLMPTDLTNSGILAIPTQNIAVNLNGNPPPYIPDIPDFCEIGDENGANVYFNPAVVLDYFGGVHHTGLEDWWEPNPNGNPTVTYSHDIGSHFPVGTTKVTVTAEDEAGNISTSSFNVHVIPRFAYQLYQNPDSYLYSINIVLDDQTYTSQWSYIGLVSATEKVLNPHPPLLATTYTRPLSGPRSVLGGYPMGTSVYTITAIDQLGNTGSSQYSVTVEPYEDPHPAPPPPSNVYFNTNLWESVIQVNDGFCEAKPGDQNPSPDNVNNTLFNYNGGSTAPTGGHWPEIKVENRVTRFEISTWGDAEFPPGTTLHVEQSGSGKVRLFDFFGNPATDVPALGYGIFTTFLVEGVEPGEVTLTATLNGGVSGSTSVTLNVVKIEVNSGYRVGSLHKVTGIRMPDGSWIGYGFFDETHPAHMLVTFDAEMTQKLHNGVFSLYDGDRKCVALETGIKQDPEFLNLVDILNEHWLYEPWGFPDPNNRPDVNFVYDWVLEVLGLTAQQAADTWQTHEFKKEETRTLTLKGEPGNTEFKVTLEIPDGSINISEGARYKLSVLNGTLQVKYANNAAGVNYEGKVRLKQSQDIYKANFVQNIIAEPLGNRASLKATYVNAEGEPKLILYAKDTARLPILDAAPGEILYGVLPGSHEEIDPEATVKSQDSPGTVFGTPENPDTELKVEKLVLIGNDVVPLTLETVEFSWTFRTWIVATNARTKDIIPIVYSDWNMSYTIKRETDLIAMVTDPYFIASQKVTIHSRNVPGGSPNLKPPTAIGQMRKEEVNVP